MDTLIKTPKRDFAAKTGSALSQGDLRVLKSTRETRDSTHTVSQREHAHGILYNDRSDLLSNENKEIYQTFVLGFARALRKARFIHS
jgi:hypothetical protein